MRGCLGAALDTDDSSFRGTPPARLTAGRFVGLRRTGLAGLVTRHRTSNHRVEIAGDRAICRCDFVIRRWPSDARDRRSLHSYGSYTYLLQHTAGGWQVVGITQVVQRSDGDPQVHGALRGRTTGSDLRAVDRGDVMATAKQKATARRNVKKAAKAARRARTSR